MNNSSLQ